MSRSSVFCALVNAIEFCKTESVIDIFEIVKAIRTQKPGAIQTVVSGYVHHLALSCVTKC